MEKLCPTRKENWHFNFFPLRHARKTKVSFKMCTDFVKFDHFLTKINFSSYFLFLPLTLDVSGIIEKLNVYATLAIIPRTKEINIAFWLVHIFIKTLKVALIGRRISLLYDSCRKNLALLLFHNYSGNVYWQKGRFYLFILFLRQTKETPVGPCRPNKILRMPICSSFWLYWTIKSGTDGPLTQSGVYSCWLDLFGPWIKGPKI